MTKIHRTVITMIAITVLALCAGCASSTPKASSSSAGDTPLATDRPVDTSWATDAIADMTDVQSVMGSISADANNADAAAVMGDCSTGTDKIYGWRNNADNIPVESVRTPYINALAEYGVAFATCSGGDFADATTHIRLGTTYINQASAAATAYVG